MNNILQLKGTFERKGARPPGSPRLPAGKSVAIKKITRLIEELKTVQEFWNQQHYGIKPLVTVQYETIVAKSNRIDALLSENGRNASKQIVGARFRYNTQNHPCSHIITYLVSTEAIDSSIVTLEQCVRALEALGIAKIGNDTLSTVNNLWLSLNGITLKKTGFAQLIKDIYYVDSIFVNKETPDYSESVFVTLFETGNDAIALLNRIGIRITRDLVIDNSVRLSSEDYRKLQRDAPYLISMSIRDISEWETSDFDTPVSDLPHIPHPSNEPTIGVIDTTFTGTPYFSEWVDYRDETDAAIPHDSQICHGMYVSSIIVDGPSLNPELDDKCGRFRVRHFGVTGTKRTSSFSIMRAIKTIVENNRDIKVWNLSLGSIKPAPDNFVSPEAAILDQLQYENDVIFVIAGTNKAKTDERRRIGAPADSINSIVVNSVDENGKAADYSRTGPVLSFYAKPDISYYGGTEEKKIMVAAPYAKVASMGTSLAAPWIARKLAFLIYKAGFSRESAKALIIDAAVGWKEVQDPHVKGYGVVPVDINDIVTTQPEEIRFMITGAVSSYETYSYNIPVPMKEGKYPYLARATLCYFPRCNRNEGVDYTSTEMDLRFGRLKDSGIDSLDNSVQGKTGSYVREDSARSLYRKWDNVKHISDHVKTRMVPRKSYDVPLWGILLRKKERQNDRSGDGLRFGVVITLREMNGVNRIDEFMQQCMLRGWLVSRIDINNRLDIYEAAEVELDFDE